MEKVSPFCLLYNMQKINISTRMHWEYKMRGNVELASELLSSCHNLFHYFFFSLQFLVELIKTYVVQEPGIRREEDRIDIRIKKTN